MDPTQTGEANPEKNTELKLNPITFDEAALAKLVEDKLLADPVPEEEVENPADPAAEADLGEEETDPPVEEVEDPDESQDADDHSQDQSRSGVQKRIDKLTAQRKAADEKAAQLERELNELRAELETKESAPPVPVVNGEQPFADIWDQTKLKDEYAKARQLKRWCEDNADGAELGGKDYSDEEIKAIRRKVEDAIDIHIPARLEFLRQHQQLKPVVEQTYPFWKDRSSTEYQEAQQVLRTMPGLATLPEYQILIGDFLEGRKARLARSKKAVPTVKRPAPRQPAQPATSPARLDPTTATRDAFKSRFAKTGSVDDLAKVLEGI